MKTNLKYLLPHFILSIVLFVIFLNSSCTKPSNQTQTINRGTLTPASVISAEITKSIISTTPATRTNIELTDEMTVTPENKLTLEPIKTSTSIYNPTTEGTPIPILTDMPINFHSIILFDGGESPRGTWIYSVDKRDSQEVVSNYFSIDWSPSGNALLLFNDQNLYISNPDGSDIQLILSDKEAWYGPHWLTEELILLDSYNLDSHRIRVDLLNISTGELQALDEDIDYEIIAVSPSRDFWFQLNTETQQMEIANIDGYRAKVEIPGGWGEIGEQRMQFLPSAKTVITEGCEGNTPGAGTACHIYSSEITNQAISNTISIYNEEPWMHIVNFLVSPDGKYLAIYYFGDPNNHDMMISFLNLETLSIDYKYIFPNHISDEYLWSPDSTMIATPYWNDSKQTGGIQLMNIYDGKLKLIPLGNYIPLITSWRILDVYK